METFWVQGVVRNGQVVLEKPLDLPDGTIVTVMDDDPRPRGPDGPLPPEVVKEIMLGLTGRLDLVDDPDWTSKIVSRRE